MRLKELIACHPRMACEPKPCLARFASRSDVGGSCSGEIGGALRKRLWVAKHLFEHSYSY